MRFEYAPGATPIDPEDPIVALFTGLAHRVPALRPSASLNGPQFHLLRIDEQAVRAALRSDATCPRSEC